MRARAGEKWSTCFAGSASTRRASSPTSGTRGTRARRWACRSRPALSRTSRFRRAASTSITMYHALEHVEDPVGILSTLRAWLSEGGLLLVEVPNVEARCIRPRHRFHFAHFYNFNRATLEATGPKAGFEPMQTTTSPDGGNLISVFVARGPAVAQDSGPVDCTATTSEFRGCVRGHTAAGYYLSRGAIRRPAGAAARVSEGPRGRARPRRRRARSSTVSISSEQ